MKLKKLLSVMVMGGLLATSLTACGNKSTSASTSGDGKIKLTAIFVKHALTKPVAEMEWLAKIEDEAGVEIEWEEITADWSQKKGTLLASGDVPDLIFGAGAVGDTDFAQFKGLFEDFTPLIETNAPNIQKMFKEHEELKSLATQLDGKIYGLPKYQRYWPKTVSRQYINKQWLDNLGLEAPTNWDELYEVLLAFKNEDANGNGDPNDEYPMDWAPDFGNFHVNLLLCSTGITISEAGGDGYFVEDGVVKNYFQDERYKELVEFLHKCYSAGLVNPEVFTQDYSKFQSIARGEGTNAKVGFTWGWEITDRVGNDVASQYMSLAPLKVSETSTIEPSWSYDDTMLNYGTNMVSMASTCKNKEAAMRFVDKFYDPEVSLQVLFGSIGPNIEKNSDGSYKILPPADSSLDPGSWKWTSTFADFGPMYISDELNVTLGTDMLSNEEQTAVFMPTIDKIDFNKDVLPKTFIKMSTEDNAQRALIQTNMLSLAKAKWASWIVDGGIEKEWDQYLVDIKATGIDELTVLWQKYYDEYMKK